MGNESAYTFKIVNEAGRYESIHVPADVRESWVKVIKANSNKVKTLSYGRNKVKNDDFYVRLSRFKDSSMWRVELISNEMHVESVPYHADDLVAFLKD